MKEYFSSGNLLLQAPESQKNPSHHSNHNMKTTTHLQQLLAFHRWKITTDTQRQARSGQDVPCTFRAAYHNGMCSLYWLNCSHSPRLRLSAHAGPVEPSLPLIRSGTRLEVTQRRKRVAEEPQTDYASYVSLSVPEGV